jgi:lysophospholipase L1-like esterase
MSGWTSGEVYTNGDSQLNECMFHQRKPGYRVALRQKRYKLALIMLGTNDAGKRIPVTSIVENIRRIAVDCQETGSQPVILTPLENKGVPDPSPNPPNWYTPYFKEMVIEIIRMSRQNNFPYIRCYRLMPFDGAPSIWAHDGLHLTQNGYQHFASLLARDLQRKQLL